MPNFRRDWAKPWRIQRRLGSGFERGTFQIWSNTTLYYLLTYSTVQSPSWEANLLSASQAIPRILWKPKNHYRIHKCPPHLSQSWASSIQSMPSQPTSCRSILILSSICAWVFQVVSFSWGFPTKTLNTPLLSLILVYTGQRISGGQMLLLRK